MEVLRDVGLPRQWPNGAVLFRQGDPALEVVGITSGRVRLSSVQASGLARTIEDRGSGDLLGEFDVLRGSGYALTAVALEDTAGLVAGRSRFQEALVSRPRYMLELLMRALADPEGEDELTRSASSCSASRRSRFGSTCSGRRWPMRTELC